MCQESGSTLVLMVYDALEKLIHVANVGDSRFMIGYDNNTFRVTKEHRPDLELERLTKCGCQVEQIDGTWRINKGLSVSRAIGDCKEKAFIISKPDYYKFNTGVMTYCLVACDGLFEVLTPEEIDSMVRISLDLKEPSSKKDKQFKKYFEEDNVCVKMKKTHQRVSSVNVFENVNGDCVQKKTA